MVWCFLHRCHWLWCLARLWCCYWGWDLPWSLSFSSRLSREVDAVLCAPRRAAAPGQPPAPHGLNACCRIQRCVIFAGGFSQNKGIRFSRNCETGCNIIFLSISCTPRYKPKHYLLNQNTVLTHFQFTFQHTYPSLLMSTSLSIPCEARRVFAASRLLPSTSARVLSTDTTVSSERARPDCPWPPGKLATRLGTACKPSKQTWW